MLPGYQIGVFRAVLKVSEQFPKLPNQHKGSFLLPQCYQIGFRSFLFLEFRSQHAILTAAYTKNGVKAQKLQFWFYFLARDITFEPLSLPHNASQNDIRP